MIKKPKKNISQKNMAGIKRKLDFDTLIDKERYNHKKRKIDKDYYLMSSSARGYPIIYKLDETHLLFNVLISSYHARAFNPLYGREGYDYEVSLWTLLTDPSYHKEEKDGGIKLEPDEIIAIIGLLGLEKLHQHEFKGLAKELTMFNIDLRRNIQQNGRILYLNSWC